MLQILPHVIPYVTYYAELPRVHTNIRGFCNHSEKEVQTEAKLIMKFIGILLCLLVLSIQVDAAKKKLLKKLAKELGYKLEEAIEELKISIWFDAFRTSVDFENTSGPWKTITYTGLRESSGSGMDINTGVFTAPKAAVYEFHYEAEYYPGSFVARARIFFSIKGGLIFSLKHRTRSQIITFY